MKNKSWLILCIIAVVAAVALSATNLITKDRIAEQALLAANAARVAALPGATGFEAQALSEGATISGLYAAEKDGAPAGYVGETTVSGYGGPIEVVLGVDAGGTIVGMSVGGSEFAETAGLGAMTREPAFTGQFVGLTSAPALGENVDAVSGATISSSAVTNGARQIYGYVHALLTGEEAPVAAAPIAISSADKREAAAMGQTEEFTVYVGVNEDGSIEAVELDGANVKTDAPYFNMLNNPEYLNQYAGKTAPLAYGDGLDAVSGATLSSRAILNAVNGAMGFESEAPAEQPGEMVTLDAPDKKGAVKIFTKTVQGYGGEIVVTVGLDAQNVVKSLKIGGPNFNETDSLGANVKSNQFRNQFVDKTGPFAYGEGVDAVSGATVTSAAVLKAINEAFEQN